ncbi:hypothetical protein WDH52_11645 [Streptomyces sp. TRM70308]|uniref:hypothetical protein n=1 Tax=Streptomyces sp. TRM70308 TaxID=3131932 RepID=UPI003D00988B
MTVPKPSARHRTSLAASLALAAVLGAGCAADGGGSAGGPPPSAPPPHGHVPGAEESAEQQSRLVLNDPASGQTRVLDLVTGQTHDVPPVEGATALTTDGRFGYFRTDDGLSVLDAGAWAVDHGDHVHYYRADIRTVGRIPAGKDAGVRGYASVTAVTTEGEGAALYRRDDLEHGRIGAGRDLAGRYAAVIPFREHLVAVPGAEGAGVRVLDRAGEETASLETPCREPRGDAVTRRGVVLGCADGAVLVRAEGADFEAVEIPYPDGVPEAERATDFRLRPGSDTLTALAGDAAVWVLDVTDRTWRRVETGPVLAANTAGEGAPLLALGTDGTLRGFDVASGRRTAQAALNALPEPAGARAGEPGAPVIAVDDSRAYVSDPAGRRVAEIDHHDSLRLARTFELDIRPGLMVETGR